MHSLLRRFPLIFALLTWCAARSPAAEVIGQSSRLTGLIVSEIMFHPAERKDGKKLEFIELMNTADTPQDIGGYALTGDAHFTFDKGTTVPARGVLAIARNIGDLASVYGITNILGPLNDGKSLPNDHGIVRLRNRQGAILLEVPYDTQAPWPVGADGAGPSLVLARPSLGEADPRAWAASDQIGGTPGLPNIFVSSPLKNIAINEISLAPAGYIELYNHSNSALDLSGCILSDDPAIDRFVFPQGTTIAPAGFVSFDLEDLTFNASASGGTLFLRSAQRQVLDAIRFGPLEPGVSFGRSPDGASALYRLSQESRSAPNADIRVSDVVINELMYHPASGNEDDQFVELYNRSSNAISLAGWTLGDGIKFTFPAEARLGAGQYIVVARNAGRLQTNYSNLYSANTFGNFSGSLSHSGERITLTMPVVVDGTNLLHVVVDEMTYTDGGRWGKWSDGGGSSLEKVDARADGRFASNWGDSDETTKAEWTSISVTGRLDNGNVVADRLQVLLQGAGECLIDNVEVRNASGQNLIANSTFEVNATGWTAQGTEQSSGWEQFEGYQSAHSYHLRAVDRGDNQVNRVFTALTTTLPANSTATVRANVRWLRGSPQILFRLIGNWLEAPGVMALPKNCGTPGASNSRAVPSAGPAIFAVQHSPLVPAAGQPVRVTAQVVDSIGLQSVSLKYRVDPSANLLEVPMKDDGSSGDEIAGDGIFTATIPGQSGGATVAFSLSASDGNSSTVFPSDTPARECLVRFGESTPTGNFPIYRVWMTQATLDQWTSRSKLNNTPLDITFVLGKDRVIYNAKALYAGSPYIAPGYTSPTSGKCGYAISFPSDDRFLGNTDLVLDWPGGHGGERTALQEQMAYWLAEQVDLPYCYRYPIRLQVNGVTDMQRGTIFEAVNQPAGDFIDAWSPKDTDGDFYKIDRAFEFNDSGSLQTAPQPRLEDYTTTGGAKKTAAYRWNWIKRAGSNSDDYSNIFALVNAVNTAGAETYTTATEALVDIDEWMGIFAMEHIIVNFDAYGHQIGKNMYAYKPENGKWQLYMFDLDWLMLAAAGYQASYAASSAPLYNSEDPTIARMYNHPPFRRAYLRTVQRAVDGPMRSEICDPVMDAKYQALLANGITRCDGQNLTDPSLVKTWFAQRRTYLISQLTEAGTSFALFTPSFTTNSSIIKLTGTAPLSVKTIRVNGIGRPLTWDTVTAWTLPIDLVPGENVLQLEALDSSEKPVASNRITITTTYSPLHLTAMTTSASGLALAWNCEPNRTYEILYAGDITSVWLHLQTISAQTTNTTLELPLSSPRRFYKIVRLPP